MPNDALLQVRIDPKTKDKAAKFFKRFGLSTSDGVRLLITQALRAKELPHIPNAETRKAIEDSRAGRDLEKTTLEGLKKIWDEA